MNERRQYRALYREFLFRVADREILSSHGRGDASRLLLQIVTLLLGASALMSLPALFVGRVRSPLADLAMTWTVEHFLIATTMLIVGIVSVLSWGAMFPDQTDALVLAPLPVRPRTVFGAKLAATAVVFATAVLAVQALASVVWPLRLNAPSPSLKIPALAYDAALPARSASNLQTTLDHDFDAAIARGDLAAGRRGLAIGVSSHGVRRVIVYGAARPDSLFEIGSVTKLFTGLALAEMTQDGRVDLDGPVRALIPDAGIASPNGLNDITPRDLVTHRSGLPGMPTDFRPRDPKNPYADFDIARLYAFLRLHGVARPPNPKFLYSNLGFGLLGHALATRAGTDYETLIRRQITEPLGMRDTAIQLSADQSRRFLQGHDADRRPVQAWDLDAIAGAGALKSTVGDMLTWLDANLHPERLPDARLSAAILRSHRRLAAVGPDGAIGFAWRLLPTGDLGHPGDTGGFSAEVTFNPAKDRAIVVLSNIGPGASLSADVVSEHVRARLDGHPALTIADVTLPARGGAGGWWRLFVAYWATMLAASLFVLGVAVALQGLMAAALPRRWFLHASPAVQIGFFCALLAAYFLQPLVISGSALLNAEAAPWFRSSPSYWFLGLFQSLSGSPALALLARRSLIALGATVIVAVGACSLAYPRLIRRMMEQPDVAPTIGIAQRLPRIGNSLDIALVHFSARTMFRSASHRVIYAFYLGLGVAITAVLLKTPRAQALADAADAGSSVDNSVPLIVSSLVMLACAIVGARLTFAIPRDRAANWIFRMVPLGHGSHYVAARRRVFVLLAAAPVWVVFSVVFVSVWPWRPALEHLVVLVLCGAVLIECCLWGTQRIPFTCGYLPGRSRVHITAPLALLALLVLTLKGAEVERAALDNPAEYAVLLGSLAMCWGAARLWTTWTTNDARATFDDELGDATLTLELWDARGQLTATSRSGTHN